MQQHIPLVIAIIVAIRAYTYARWIRRQGNKAGSFGVILIALAGPGLVLYRMLRS